MTSADRWSLMAIAPKSNPTGKRYSLVCDCDAVELGVNDALVASGSMESMLAAKRLMELPEAGGVA